MNSIRVIRAAYDLTQAQLAEIIGVSEITIHRWEQKKRAPTAKGLKELSEKFNLSYEFLLSDNPLIQILPAQPFNIQKEARN